MTVQAHSANPAGKESIGYEWAAQDRQEQFTFKDLEVGFEPVETANFLREQQGRPAPEWLPDVDNRSRSHNPSCGASCRWRMVQRELPFLNLTAQIFLDAEIGPRNPPATVAPFMLQGAAAIGNDHEAVLKHYRDEQPWNLTLTDAQKISGKWTLRECGRRLRVGQGSRQLDRTRSYLQRPLLAQHRACHGRRCAARPGGLGDRLAIHPAQDS